ncbi:ubiquitin carboxyl-terminal hydrolase 25-like [Mya arenaria]|uniref:ubiquitin carboxyl-terminal hydrolase 25-like n=1 Tax=Mya arenaria TaxID=6604 RepID=UPI0022E1BF1A|nr:ubiquitin carboxyl-terminal hydrolase 25-like [Mya arenaria]XP_052804866.1 ubiquitin carboxyl-terminal hydrolase 25-like [Mya arenaria]XP_052804867.1 ubiquitin carboxyl-terminal hydrolase 25-like [Mya arenaria]XP_052804868.1 ubiquitin carboxyl-terminal hydrolase 25-like [Mya arenaria]
MTGNMTVEQPEFPQIGQTKPCDDHTYAQVKEITGITDRKLIEQAVTSCRNNDGKYDVSDVVGYLIGDDNKRKGKKVVKAVEEDEADAVAGPAQNLNKKGGVIDLTNVSDTNESEDIQKAIAASLVDSGGPYVQETSPGILGGQVSREEQDISRVLEQSLIESKAGTKRKRGDIWFVDPLNPHERKRKDSWPIGLKNVGNTCWFSAVMQSLFHLRRFRHLVLTYQPPKEVQQGTSQMKRNLRFMQELRHLFALMIGSRRKYVDPSKAVDILKEAFNSAVVSSASVTDSQQDVSEFQHKLLDWLEDAFKSASRPNTPDPDAEKTDKERSCHGNNPMVDLFYGQFRAEGVNEGKDFSNEETFGQFPLQVNGFRDIHESLEAATALREIETVSSESSQKSGQELWFTRLPPVLTFELSRFQFNQQIGRPEKIHNKIEFPHVIYMDRYMDCNREETRQRRERAKKLKEELVALQFRLEKFTNYGSGKKRYPLQDVLSYALEFAKTRPESPRKTVTVSQDIEMECLSPNNSLNMMVDSPIKSPPDVPMATVTSPLAQGQSSPDGSQGNQNPGNQDNQSPNKESPSPAVTVPTIPVTMVTAQPSCTGNTPPDVTMATENRSSPITTETECSERPHPRHVSDGELVVLQDCLHRWRTEVEHDVKELQEGIGRLEDSISRMYSDEPMTKHPYHLHAVLVHEGQAASGHYWAYIHDAGSDSWLKFNDITVTEASWEELEKDSVGGYHNTSAYCLMYIDKTRIEEEAVSGKAAPGTTSDLENLPVDLGDLVTVDNKLFSEEIERWDRELARKAAGSGDSDVVENKPALPHPNMSSSSTVSTQTTQPAVRQINFGAIHAQLSANESAIALRRVLETEDLEAEKGLSNALNRAVEMEHKRIKNIVDKELPSLFPKQDPRLQHIVAFLIHCECKNSVTLIMLLEQFAELIYDNNENIKRLKQLAGDWMKQLKCSKEEEVEKQYIEWHEMYQKYLKTALLFIKGVSLYFEEKHVQALAYLLHAHLLSLDLLKMNRHAILPEPNILAFFFRQTLLHLNDTLAHQFESKAEVSDILEMVLRNVVPCLQTVVNIGNTEDVAAVEDIREKWCNFLGQEMEASKVELLQDFLSKLFEPPSELRVPRMPKIGMESFHHIHKQYSLIMEKAMEYGDIEKALKGS